MNLLQQMLKNTLENQLRTRSPQMYAQYASLVRSGQSPEQIIQSLVSSGQISPQLVEQAKAQANQQLTQNVKRF